MFNPATVRAEIARSGMSIEEVARVSGLSSSAIHKALGPLGNPTVETLRKIAKAIGTQEVIFFDVDLHNSVNAAS